MSTNPSAFGNSPTGVAGGALSGTYPSPTLGNVAFWEPSDNGFLAANDDLYAATGSFTMIAGTVYLAKLLVRAALTATNLTWISATAGSGASTGSFTGLYNSAGTLLTSSADIGTAFAAQGAITTALTTPQALSAGTFVWAAILFNLASTQPNIGRGVGVVPGVSNVGLSAAVSRFATAATAQSTLPGSFTPSALTQDIASLWVGVT